MGIADVPNFQNNDGDQMVDAMLKSTAIPLFVLGKNLIFSPQTLAGLSKLVRAR